MTSTCTKPQTQHHYLSSAATHNFTVNSAARITNEKTEYTLYALFSPYVTTTATYNLTVVFITFGWHMA